MKNILITGTYGFIGSQLKQHFLSLGYNVHEINEDIFTSEFWFDVLIETLYKVQPDAIFHMGACSNTLEQNVNYMMVLNYEFTKILADYTSFTKTPLIYSSSAANYGINNRYPSNLYGWSKYIAEDYVRLKSGIGLRYFNVYGPGEHNKGRMASVAYQMYVKNQNSEKINLFPNKPLRDFVYVKDIISANIYAWENYNSFKGNFYEVGSGKAKGFEDVLDLMDISYSHTDESLIPKGYQFYTCSDSSKWMPGWESQWNLEAGISDYKKHLKSDLY